MTVIDQPPRSDTKRNLPAISPPRLPYHPGLEERFGVDISSWKALVEAIFPNAQSVESVILALSYCKARKLDPFKRNVHIVPIWDKNRRQLVDTIWPGIGELRTTAFRTGEYAGKGRVQFGPIIKQKVGSREISFPEWAQVTVYRMVKGERVAFEGPQVWWLETYATAKRDDDTPNEMWETRSRGQLEKCAEAAALRAAFPEEIGSDYTADEAEGFGPRRVLSNVVGTEQPRRSLDERLATARAAQAQASGAGVTITGGTFTGPAAVATHPDGRPIEAPSIPATETEADRILREKSPSAQQQERLDDSTVEIPDSQVIDDPDVAGADAEPPPTENETAQQPAGAPKQDPKLLWEEFHGQMRDAANANGLTNQQFEAALKKVMVKEGVVGKEWKFPETKRATLYDAVVRSEGHFAKP